MRSQQRVIAALLTATFEAWRSLQTQFCCSLCALLSLAWCLSAQTSSTITGTVRDKQGLAVAGAEIRVTSAELAIERSTVTEPDGKKPMPLIVSASPPCGEPEVGMPLMNGFRLVSSWLRFEGLIAAAAPPLMLAKI